MTNDTLPVLDADAFRGSGWHRALDEACATWGCFQLVNHGVPDNVLAQAQHQMRAFFRLPADSKHAIERSQRNPWGFYDRELTKNRRDWKEIFDVGPACREGPLAGAEPQWPRQLAPFRPAIESLSRAFHEVALRLLAAVASNLGASQRALLADFEAGHTSFQRLNYYPPCPDPGAHLGISHHTDAGAVTVLLHDGVPGLQFYHDGAWITPVPDAGSLIVNLGDIVQVWSNDRYPAPLHRVLANATAERFSAPYFLNPRYAANYAPLPGALNGAEPRYQTINWGEFRAGRAAGDYADVGEEIQIADFRRQ